MAKPADDDHRYRSTTIPRRKTISGKVGQIWAKLFYFIVLLDSKLKILSRERDMQRVSTLQENMRLLKNPLGYEKIDEIRKHFNEETPVPDGLHVPLNDLFRKYAVVGGMPEAVNTFLETNNISDVYEVQQNIIEEYKDDMVKYPQLAKENKKAQYSVVKRCLPS